MVSKGILALFGIAAGVVITGLVLSQKAAAEPIREEPTEPIPTKTDEQDLIVIFD